MPSPVIVKAGSEDPDPLPGISYPIPRCLDQLRKTCTVIVTEDEDEQTLVDAVSGATVLMITYGTRLLRWDIAQSIVSCKNRSGYQRDSAIRMMPLATTVAAMARFTPSGSFNISVPITAAKMTLVSRNAATCVIGDKVIA